MYDNQTIVINMTKKGVKPNESRLKYSKIVCLKFYF